MTRCSFITSRLSLKISLVLIVFIAGCSAPAQVRISPSVKATRSGVEIRNPDAFTYPQVTVFVKGHFAAEAGDIAAGQTVLLPFEKFVNDEGQHFDVATMAPEAIRIRAWFSGRAVSRIYEVK